MKKTTLLTVFLLIFSSAAFAQRFKYTEASDLTLIGKIMDTPNPYHRVDTCIHKGFTERENFQLRCGSGLAVVFKTNSSIITLKNDIGDFHCGPMTSELGCRGFDLYIKKDGKWIYAGSKVNPEVNDGRTLVLAKDMNSDMKECMIHFPIYSELLSVRIGVDKDAVIEPAEPPFRHRVAIYGSSFTQGSGVSRPGMTYPMQFVRNTGIQMLSVGCGGNGKMQPQYAEMLAKVNVDAMVFDCFSNPSAELIEERTIPFIRTIREAHPDIPLIFIRTVYRESRNFSTKSEATEQAKMDMAEKMMEKAMEEFDDVYFVNPKTLAGYDHETSVDGTHPSDMGYYRWAKAIEKPVLRILHKYGIK